MAAAPGTGRTVRLHPQEALLQQGRALLQSEAFSEYRQRRVVVEHRLARLVQLGIRQSRYFGRIKTRFQLYLAATAANLTLEIWPETLILPKQSVFLTSIIDETVGISMSYMHYWAI